MTPVEPLAPSGVIQARVAESFARQGLMQTLGAKLVHADAGWVRIELPTDGALASRLSQQHGFVHAGAVTSIVDSACGYAALTLMPPDAEVLTIEFKVNFMSPARGARLVADGRVRKAGKTVTFTEGEVRAMEGERSALVATIAATMVSRLPDAPSR